MLTSWSVIFTHKAPSIIIQKLRVLFLFFLMSVKLSLKTEQIKCFPG